MTGDTLRTAHIEDETLNGLAEGLAIDEDRANELLDDVEKDLGGQKTE